MNLTIPGEEVAAAVSPLLHCIGEALAAHLVRLAEAAADDKEGGLMDKAETARYLKIEERALENWMRPIEKGGRGIPYSKIGETVRFRRSRINAWLLTLERNSPEVVQWKEAA
jgi:hypothetical protein